MSAAASSGLIKSSIEVNCENTSTRRPSLASSRTICIKVASLLLVTTGAPGISALARDPASAFRIAASLTRRGSQHTCRSLDPLHDVYEAQTGLGQRMLFIECEQ